MQVKGAGVRGRNTLPTTKRNFLIGFEVVNTISRKIATAELFRTSRMQIARDSDSVKRKREGKKEIEKRQQSRREERKEITL